jgi:hypothetical protein
MLSAFGEGIGGAGASRELSIRSVHATTAGAVLLGAKVHRSEAFAGFIVAR